MKAFLARYTGSFGLKAGGVSRCPKKVGSRVTIKLMFALAARVNTSMVAMAVVAIPLTGVAGSPGGCHCAPRLF